jgi:hypothetical protein
MVFHGGREAVVAIGVETDEMMQVERLAGF